MSSARKLTEIPSCMRMSFNYPWESSPAKEIGDPLSHDLPDILSDFEAIYGECAARHFFPSTPTKSDKVFPVLQDDSLYADICIDLFGSGSTPESSPKAESSPASSSGYMSDLSSLSRISPSPSSERGVPGGKKERQTTTSKTRARRVPYQRHLLDSPPGLASPLNRPDYPRFQFSRTSPRSSISSSVSTTNSDDVLTPEFMRSLQFVSPGTPVSGPSSLPGSHSPILHPRRYSKSPVKPRPSPSKPAQQVTVNASQQPEAFAHRYCRFPNCDKRFADKRTTERHRLTHLDFGTYVCPNPACDSRTKVRPNFASDFSLGRHLRLAADDSPCAVGKGQKLSSFRLDAAQVGALVQQALVPFDPTIHAPFQ